MTEHLEEGERWEKCGSCLNYRDSEYKIVPEEELHNYSTYTKGVHCLIYAPYNQKIFGRFDARAAVMMQMRFDGCLGFPGGLVDEGEDVVTALNRELKEEINLETIKVQKGDYISSYRSDEKKMLLHFYALGVTYSQFLEIERNSPLAEEYGLESLGSIRVPLYTMDDGIRGFPAFLTNCFAGNARQQLLSTLQHLELMTTKEIAIAESCLRRKQLQDKRKANP